MIYHGGMQYWKRVPWDEVEIWYMLSDAYNADASLRMVNNLQAGSGMAEPDSVKPYMDQLQEKSKRLFPGRERMMKDLEERKRKMMAMMMGMNMPIDHLAGGVVQEAGMRLKS